MQGDETQPHSPQGPQSARGLLIVMTGASGVGKGTLREQWLAGKDVFYSVSWTTREQRPGERDGTDYHYRTREQFEAEMRGGGFLEYAEFVGNFYGTPRAPVDAALARGQDVVLEIEVEGAMQVAAKAPEAILVFIVPPSLAELRRRLTTRGTESMDRIERRLARAREEILAAHAFKYVIVNDTVDRAVADLEAVMRAERVHAQRFSDADLRRIVEN